MQPLQQLPLRHLPPPPLQAVPSAAFLVLQLPAPPHAASLHSRRFAVQSLQLTPFWPQYWIVEPGLHAPPPMQPWQQLPLQQRPPLQAARSGSSTVPHFPPLQTGSLQLPARQVAQATPPAPQAETVLPATQTPAAKQPGQPLQPPPVQIFPDAEQSMQALPPEPHTAFELPAWQLEPFQQPAQQLPP
jgi:hypothetical protein